ncbi:hypothetical protein CA54_44510 [Symmachiella macrocystis]|uniref:Uncharacterized protein n=1 Tax=Symmachiella macrocystis TaxID=2527985 RepID=A0A5C6BCH6_9PLAN|nr:hypothetical protein CA54_44510 [Symmachiella macrocystis]
MKTAQALQPSDLLRGLFSFPTQSAARKNDRSANRFFLETAHAQSVRRAKKLDLPFPETGESQYSAYRQLGDCALVTCTDTFGKKLHASAQQLKDHDNRTAHAVVIRNHFPCQW